MIYLGWVRTEQKQDEPDPVQEYMELIRRNHGLPDDPEARKKLLEKLRDASATPGQPTSK